MIDPKLLAILACPACQGDLTEETPQQLGCLKCGRKYPVKNGIPVLLVHDAGQ